MNKLAALLSVLLLAATGTGPARAQEARPPSPTPCCAAPAGAQDYPSRPVTVIVPFAPGSATDIITRALGKGLADRLGKPVVVDNRAGAGGTIGAAAAAKAAPDGHTIVMGTNGPFAANVALYSKLPHDPVKEFVPVIHVVNLPLLMVAGPTVSAKSVPEMVAMAKASPGKLNFGVTNTTARAWVELVKKMAGIQVESVLYQGPGPMLNDLMGGRIQFAVENVGPTLPLIRAGKIAGLAAMSPTRAPFAPELPALAESGYTQYEVMGWLGIFAPAGTPAPIVARLNADIAASLKSKEVNDLISAIGIPAGGTPAQFAALQKRDIATWIELVKSTGIRIE